MGLGALAIPDFMQGRSIDPAELLSDGIDVKRKKQLADVALNTAKSKGATYTDVRIGRYLNQFVSTRENRVQGVANTESFGVGVRVIANGCWGFAASNEVTPESMARTAERAVAVAKANSKLGAPPVQLAAQKGFGEVSWKTPIEKNPFEVPIKEKLDLLLAANAIAMAGKASFVNSTVMARNEQKYLATSDGSYIDQDLYRISPSFTVNRIDRAAGGFATRNSFSSPIAMGYEYLTPTADSKVPGIVTRYKNRYDIMEDMKAATTDVEQKLKAKSVEPGKYDLVLDPSHLWLTIHESVAHPTELDRVLGYEANYAGTSFLTLDKWRSKKFNFGNKLVNIVADRMQPHSLGAIGYDDEGVEAQKWDIIKDGLLVNYQVIRDQAHVLGLKQSQGCCYAQSWNDVQFQRMPNVSLQPGKQKLSVADMIKGVEKGIYIIGDGSFSIDQQRYNFQFGGQTFYEIKNGQITGMLKDVAYQAITQEFWNSVGAIADESDYRLGGAFSDGKGQPGQSNSVSHGSSTTLFKGINVINTARKIG